MRSQPNIGTTLRSLWTRSTESRSANDYDILSEFNRTFVGRSKNNEPAILFPLSAPASGGRHAVGCAFLAHGNLEIRLDERSLSGPFAALVCRNEKMLDSFLVLASDVLAHFDGGSTTWRSLLAIVDEWLELLSPRGVPSPEAELGLWGELWCIVQSADVDAVVAAWRGPDGSMNDFFIDGVSVEVKTSRSQRNHHVSFDQVKGPLAAIDAWVVSIWVEKDPVGTLTVPDLVDRILARSDNVPFAYKRITKAGYSPGERDLYASRFRVLESPEWYPLASIPTIRAMDPGISHIRYRVALDGGRRANEATAAKRWSHFIGTDRVRLEDETD